MFWEIKDELIAGELTKFRLEGDPNGTYFVLQQPNDVYEQIYFPYQIYEIHKVNQYRRSDFWFNEQSILGKEAEYFYIYTYNGNAFSRVKLGTLCTDFEYLDRNNFVVLCLENYILQIRIINKDGNVVNQQEIQITEILSYHLAISNKYSNAQLLIYTPAYASATLNIQSIIYVFSVNQYVIENTSYQLDKKRLSDLFQNELKYFSVIDVQFVSNLLYILDFRLGPILLTLDAKGNFTQAKQITSSIYFKEYYSFSIQQTRLEQLIIFGKNMQEQMCARFLKSGRFTDSIKTFNEYHFELGLSRIQITQNFYLLNTISTLIIFDDNYLVDVVALHDSKFIANPNMNTYVVVHVKGMDFYELGSGILRVRAQIKESQSEEYLQLIEISNGNSCFVDIILKVYDKLDSQVQTNYLSPFYSQTLVYYPPYPDLYYQWPKMTNGPNAHQLVILHSGENKIESKFSLYSQLKISGISQFDQHSVIFSTINNNQGLNQYLVQTENLSTFIYECKLIELEQQCSQKILFYPLVQLNEGNIKWIEAGIYDSYIGIMTQNNHVLTIYRIGQTKITQQFQIKTSLQDEKAQITDFAINSFNVFALISAMNEVQVYLIQSRKLVYTIPQVINSQKIYISNIFNTHLLFIKSNNIIKVGHYFNEFNVISQIKVTEQEDAQMLLSIFRSTLVIVYRTITESGILQYLIHNLNKITLLRKLPLYYYQLPAQLQLASNSINNLIFLTAYSPFTQTSVILVYQINEYSRNSLLTTLDINLYLQGQLNYCVAGLTNTIVQFIYQGSAQSFIYFKQPRVYLNYITKSDHYQQFIQFNQLEWNDYYLTKREYKKHIYMVDMQLRLKWHQENINLELVSGNENQVIILEDSWIQGQRISFKITCTLCTTDNDGGQIYLENQFKKSTRQITDQPVNDMININENNILLLLSLTGRQQFIQFLNNYATVMNEIQLENELNYAATKIYYLNPDIVIILLQKPSSENPILQFYLRQDFNLTYKGKLILKIQIIDIKYYNNCLVVLATNSQAEPTLYFYNAIIDCNRFIISKYDLVINKYYFHKNFNVTSIDIFGYGNTVTLFLSEYNTGVVAIKLQLTSEEISIVSFNFMELNFAEQGLAKPMENQYIQIQIYRSEIYYNVILLVDQINETYLLKISNIFILTIVQIFQKFGNIKQLPQIGVVDQYLISIYNIESKYYYCLYNITEFERNEDITSNVAICKAGIKLGGSDQQASKNFLFRKDNFDKYELLINYQSSSDGIALYILESKPRIVVKSTQGLANYSFNLIAINPYEQVQLTLNFTLSPPSNKDSGMTTLFVLLIIVVSICCIGFIACILLQMYLNKHRKRRRSYKSMQ